MRRREGVVQAMSRIVTPEAALGESSVDEGAVRGKS